MIASSDKSEDQHLLVSRGADSLSAPHRQSWISDQSGALQALIAIGQLDAEAFRFGVDDQRVMSGHAMESIAAQGGARGGLSCAEPGCAEMLAFLQSTKRDLLESLPKERAQLIDEGLQLIYQPRASDAGAGGGSAATNAAAGPAAVGSDKTASTGNITVRWSNATTKLQDALGGLIPGANLFGP